MFVQTPGFYIGADDKNGKPIYTGHKVRLVLEDGTERIFDVGVKTVKRRVQCHPGFTPEYAEVEITGVVFSCNGFDFFPCVDANGIADTEKMEVIDEKQDGGNGDA